MSLPFDKKFYKLALDISDFSKDAFTKVGAVIVGPHMEIRSCGYNGVVRDVRDDVPERLVRPEKYKWFEHAERNAIYNAARVGIPLQDCSIYMHSPIVGPPCCDCTRAIIQSGIVRIVSAFGSDHPDFWEPRWGDSFLASMEMIEESGIIFDVMEKA